MINFYRHRNKYYAISLAIILLGIIMLFVNDGPQLDIQFKGGAILKYTYAGDLNTDDVDSLVTGTLDGRPVDVQQTTSNISGDDGISEVTTLVLNLSGNEALTQEQQLALEAALKEKYPDANFVSAGSSIVKPFIGQRFLFNSLKALVIASILMIAYIWYSFRKVSGLSAGVFSFVALLHDVAVVFFTFVIFGIPINDSFIAVALTILGFSLNDTIVIFDRIRENKRFYGAKMPIDELVTKSINQSLTRCINTNIATFLSILIVYIFAVIYNIESIRTFALPMCFGILSGGYSTICLVGPMWASWQKKSLEAKKAKTA